MFQITNKNCKFALRAFRLTEIEKFAFGHPYRKQKLEINSKRGNTLCHVVKLQEKTKQNKTKKR